MAVRPHDFCAAYWLAYDSAGEAELEQRFGDEYRAYKRAVPATLLPDVFHLAKARQR